MTVTTSSGHSCLLDREFRGVAECACGQRWMPAGGLTDFVFVSSQLRSRLHEHQLSIEFGRYADLAAAVKAASARERERHLEAVERDNARWLRKQRSKPARWRKAMAVIVLDGRPCAYCESPDPVVVEHVIPKSRGGSDVLRNLAASCVHCNCQKGNRTPAEWKAWRLARGMPWPPSHTAAGSVA